MKKQFLAIWIICSGFCFSQERYITDEEFKQRVTWLLPHEENIPLKDVIGKVPGYGGGKWEVDGILHFDIPTGIISSHVKYIEVPYGLTNITSKCDCGIIIKTIVTEKEFNSRDNILNRLNLKRTKNDKKKKKKKKKK